jgi:uncharacterized protein (TIGR02449 family)
MQAELDSLEDKLAQLVQLTQRLRVENHQLRQDLAQALSQGRQCHDKVDNAKARLERLLTQLPEEDI